MPAAVGVIDEEGNIIITYTEAIKMDELGKLEAIRRASHVEPDADGKWWADMGPVKGPKLGPFGKRSEAIEAEIKWIEENFDKIDEQMFN